MCNEMQQQPQPEAEDTSGHLLGWVIGAAGAGAAYGIAKALEPDVPLFDAATRRRLQGT